MATRLDLLGTVRKTRRTPQGGISAPAYLTRTGVFEYRNADGTTRRELRHPDDVFQADSLETLQGAPVTVGHPGKVTTATWKKDAVGHVGDTVSPDDRFVAATLRVQDEEAANKIDAGELVELSCGYDCDYVDGAGEYDGEQYDGRQTNIRYNHVGLGPRHWGRAGSEVQLRLDGDSTFYTVGMRIDNADKPTPPAPPLAAPEPTVAPAPTVTVHVDHAEIERLRGANQILTAENVNLKTAASPASVDALVDARLSLREKARNILGPDFTFAGMTDRQVRSSAVAKAYPTMKLDSQSDEALCGMFDIVCASPHPSLARTNEDATASVASGAEDIVEAAKKRNAERNKNAFGKDRK